MPIEGEAHQARGIFYYFLPPGLAPTFIVDVSEHFEEWSRALAVHQSQFNNPNKPRAATSGPASILDWFDVYARRDGFTIGAKYAQAYYSAVPLKIGDPMTLVREVVPRP